MFAYSADKISVGPKFTTLKFLFYEYAHIMGMVHESDQDIFVRE